MTLQIELLDEKALAILEGLRNMNVIKIYGRDKQPVVVDENSTGSHAKEDVAGDKETTPSVLDFVGVWANGGSIEETDAQIVEMRSGWL